MSDGDWSFAPPAFNAQEAVQRLRRDLRELGLSEREGRWERRGVAIAMLRCEPPVIEASCVSRPSRQSPEWISRSLRHSGDVRDFLSDLKKQLSRWSDHDD